MRKDWLISRRTALKGLGVSLMLPLLEQMGWADPPKGGAYKPPVRLCYIYIPYGTHVEHIWPKTPVLNATSELPQILEPLRPVIGKVMPIAGLDLLRDLGVTGAGMGGHHANEVAAWLSGRLIKQNDPDNAITADQVAANALGHLTALPSLELSFEKAQRSDSFDKGFNGAFFEHVSWRSESTPMPNEINPRAVFDRLFSTRRAAPVRLRRFHHWPARCRRACGPDRGPSPRAPPSRHCPRWPRCHRGVWSRQFQRHRPRCPRR